MSLAAMTCHNSEEFGVMLAHFVFIFDRMTKVVSLLTLLTYQSHTNKIVVPP